MYDKIQLTLFQHLFVQLLNERTYENIYIPKKLGYMSFIFFNPRLQTRGLIYNWTTASSFKWMAIVSQLFWWALITSMLDREAYRLFLQPKSIKLRKENPMSNRKQKSNQAIQMPTISCGLPLISKQPCMFGAMELGCSCN